MSETNPIGANIIRLCFMHIPTLLVGSESNNTNRKNCSSSSKNLKSKAVRNI